jgi:hypothetical protein
MFKGLQVPIDACIVGSQHSAFLQQVWMDTSYPDWAKHFHCNESIGILCCTDQDLEFHGYCISFPKLIRLLSPTYCWVVNSLDYALVGQASHITGGIYMKPPQPEGLFQYLTVGHMQAFVLSIKFYWYSKCRSFLAHSAIFSLMGSFAKRAEHNVGRVQMVFATDLYSRQFLQLPRSAGVDFRAS